MFLLRYPVWISHSMEKMHIRPLTDLIHKRGGVIMLIKIEAIVREEKFEQVKSALQDIQVNGVTIGYGVWNAAWLYRNCPRK